MRSLPPIPAYPDNHVRLVSLGYILSPDRKRTLMLFHDVDPKDDSYGKYNGYSSPILATESACESFRRTINEQTGLEVLQARFRGSIHWTNFPTTGQSTFAQVFLCTEFAGREVTRVDSLGENRWVRLTELARGDYPLWDGDQRFLDLVFSPHSTIPFHGYMPYNRGVPRDWFYQQA